jgi:type I restriction enzyme S subunit
MPTNIGNRLEINTGEIAFISESDVQRLSRHKIKAGDIVYSRRGDVEKCAYITENQDGWLCGTGCLRIRFTSTAVNSKFAAYYLSTPEIKSWVLNSAVGTTMPNLNTSILGGLPLLVPPLQEQKLIASVLSSLDDKIDLLHRQSNTLESLAETLFMQWFVEEAGESWDEITLSTIADHVKSSINPAKNPQTSFYHYSLPAFDEGQEPRQELGSEILSNKYQVLPKSILMSKLNPRTPRIWRMDKVLASEFSVASTEFQVVKPKDESWYGFIYCFLKSPKVSQELSNSAGGTSGSHQRVNPDDIFSLTFLRPPDDKVKKFNFATDEFWKKITRNKAEIRTLTRMRDTLLPKLMGGEVRLNSV